MLLVDLLQGDPLCRKGPSDLEIIATFNLKTKVVSHVTNGIYQHADIRLTIRSKLVCLVVLIGIAVKD